MVKSYTVNIICDKLHKLKIEVALYVVQSLRKISEVQNQFIWLNGSVKFNRIKMAQITDGPIKFKWAFSYF